MDITAWEFKVLDAIACLQSPFLDALFRWISRLGDGGGCWLMVAVAELLCGCFGSPKKRAERKKYRDCGLKLLLTLLCGAILTNLILKKWIARPRPCWVRNFSLLIPKPKDFSFPSGHTQASVAAAFVLLRCHSRLGRAAAFLSALMGFSRMYLCVHYPSDILGGVLVGILSGLAGLKLFSAVDRLWQRRTGTGGVL